MQNVVRVALACIFTFIFQSARAGSVASSIPLPPSADLIEPERGSPLSIFQDPAFEKLDQKSVPISLQLVDQDNTPIERSGSIVSYLFRQITTGELAFIYQAPGDWSPFWTELHISNFGGIETNVIGDADFLQRSADGSTISSTNGTGTALITIFTNAHSFDKSGQLTFVNVTDPEAEIFSRDETTVVGLFQPIGVPIPPAVYTGLLGLALVSVWSAKSRLCGG